MIKKKLQVFVSSTFTDLIDERQAAVSAILKAGHIPAGMELFKSGDKSQLDTIKKWIDDCDIYMLILGGRYGSVEPVTGKSYTELEFDYAIEKGLPVFSVVINENALELKVKAHGTGFIERDNPKLLSEFRAKVLSYISSFFSDEKDIKLCVLESLSEFSADRKLVGWVSGAELQDNSSLIEQNKKLLVENERLIKELEALKKKSSAKDAEQSKQKNIDELIKLLHDKKILVPAVHCGQDSDTEISLANIFFSVKDDLIGGVENSMQSTKLQIFLYYNVCPTLEMYDLVSNEKVAGVKYRRFSTTKLGKEVLVEIDKRKIEAKRADVSKDG